MEKHKYLKFETNDDGYNWSKDTNMNAEETLGVLVIMYNKMRLALLSVSVTSKKKEENFPNVLEFIQKLKVTYPQNPATRLKHYVEKYIIDNPKEKLDMDEASKLVIELRMTDYKIYAALEAKINHPSLDTHLLSLRWIRNIGKKSLGLLKEEIQKELINESKHY